VASHVAVAVTTRAVLRHDDRRADLR
jgi:hypothetical protein